MHVLNEHWIDNYSIQCCSNKLIYIKALSWISLFTLKLCLKSYFSNACFFEVFQSMSASVHCCHVSRKWTPETTMNKNSQYCSVILYSVKKQVTRHLWNSRFSCESIFVRSVQCCLRRIWTTLTRQYSYAMLLQHGRYNIV